MKKKTKTENDTKDIKDECGMGTLKEKYQEKKDKRKNEINEAGSQEGQREKKDEVHHVFSATPTTDGVETGWRSAWTGHPENVRNSPALHFLSRSLGGWNNSGRASFISLVFCVVNLSS